ncbi:hypothetical protein M0804_009752 [Polistes exclamans]|nr:hypothetical protein M0804_009752 [Polistes exclamans]
MGERRRGRREDKIGDVSAPVIPNAFIPSVLPSSSSSSQPLSLPLHRLIDIPGISMSDYNFVTTSGVGYSILPLKSSNVPLLREPGEIREVGESNGSPQKAEEEQPPPPSPPPSPPTTTGFPLRRLQKNEQMNERTILLFIFPRNRRWEDWRCCRGRMKMAGRSGSNKKIWACSVGRKELGAPSGGTYAFDLTEEAKEEEEEDEEEEEKEEDGRSVEVTRASASASGRPPPSPPSPSPPPPPLPAPAAPLPRKGKQKLGRFTGEQPDEDEDEDENEDENENDEGLTLSLGDSLILRPRTSPFKRRDGGDSP